MCVYIPKKKRKKDNKTDVANETTQICLKKTRTKLCKKRNYTGKKPLFRVIRRKRN
jgi:hypothetical protein